MPDVRPSEKGSSSWREALFKGDMSDVALRLAWIATLGKITLMAAVLIMPNLVAAAFNSVIWVLLIPYLALQVWATAIRKIGDVKGWAIDNVLALLGVLFGLYQLTQSWFWAFYSPDHHAVIMKSTVVGALDLGFGLLLSLVIAQAMKARDES